MTEIERFESKYLQEPNTGCWLWIGAHNKQGYGFFNLRRKHMGAHRASYLIFKGPIPKGVDIMHSCDTPACVNPNHLSIGTRKDNVFDCVKKGRFKNGGTEFQKKKTHCPHGHPFDEKNTIWRKDARPQRECRACKYERTRKARAKKSSRPIRKRILKEKYGSE